MDFDALTAFAASNSVDLTVVGPEAPLVAGIKEAFDAKGLLCLAPSKTAAQLEGSKRFAKEFMVRHQIPTALYEAFVTPEPAKRFARGLGLPVVVKADGLAAGKGVVIAATYEAADQTIDDMLSGNAFGDAGAEVVIEEFLQGEEASYIVISDGERTVPLPHPKTISEFSTMMRAPTLEAWVLTLPPLWSHLLWRLGLRKRLFSP